MIHIFSSLLLFIFFKLLFETGLLNNYIGIDLNTTTAAILALCYFVLSLPTSKHSFLRWFENILKLSLCVCAGLGIFYVYSNSDSELISSTTENTDSTYNVVIEADDIYSTQASEIEAIIYTMPSFLLENVSTIYIEDEATYIAKGKENSNDGVESSAAYSYSKDMSIHIRIITDPNISNEYDQTIAHELSHIFDFKDGNILNPYGYSSDDEFVALYQADPYSISEYGATDASEFFAEAGGLYITNPTALAQQNYAVYQYFDALYGPYMQESETTESLAFVLEM